MPCDGHYHVACCGAARDSDGNRGVAPTCWDRGDPVEFDRARTLRRTEIGSGDHYWRAYRSRDGRYGRDIWSSGCSAATHLKQHAVAGYTAASRCVLESSQAYQTMSASRA